MKYQKQALKDILDEIDALEGHEFEHYCANLLDLLGYDDVTVTPGSNDQGADIIAAKGEYKYAFQCKRYNSVLNNKPIQEIATGRAVYQCDIGIVITNNYFNENAKIAAKSTGILLWDRDKLIELLKTAGVVNKKAEILKRQEQQERDRIEKMKREQIRRLEKLEQDKEKHIYTSKSCKIDSTNVQEASVPTELENILTKITELNMAYGELLCPLTDAMDSLDEGLINYPDNAFDVESELYYVAKTIELVGRNTKNNIAETTFAFISFFNYLKANGYDGWSNEEETSQYIKEMVEVQNGLLESINKFIEIVNKLQTTIYIHPEIIVQIENAIKNGTNFIENANLDLKVIIKEYDKLKNNATLNDIIENEKTIIEKREQMEQKTTVNVENIKKEKKCKRKEKKVITKERVKNFIRKVVFGYFILFFSIGVLGYPLLLINSLSKGELDIAAVWTTLLLTIDFFLLDIVSVVHFRKKTTIMWNGKELARSDFTKKILKLLLRVTGVFVVLLIIISIISAVIML